MIVSHGRIVERGPHVSEGPFDQVVDLSGKWLLPAFVDNHSHIEGTGTHLGYPSLVSCQTKEEVLESLAGAVAARRPAQLIAVQYDQNRWGGPHLTALELDKISTQIPILVRHSNGHAAVANSAAFNLASIHPYQEDLPSGTFGRDETGVVNGPLFESAVDLVARSFPKPELQEIKTAIRRANQKVKELGFREVCDMGSHNISALDLLKAYDEVWKEAGSIDMRIYMHWKDLFGPKAVSGETLEQYRHLIAGVKIFCDGAIGSATAAIYGNYLTESSSAEKKPLTAAQAQFHTSKSVSGLLMYPPDKLKSMVRTATDKGFQVATHAIGDFAVDLVMDAYEESGRPSLHRIEHAMILSDQQIERIAKLGCFVSIQPEFLSRFGKAYQNQLGTDRATKLIRSRSLLQAGVKLSASTDRPIVEGDPKVGVRLLRQRPEGFDQSENLDGNSALKLWLENASHANCSKANDLTAGQKCEAVIFDSDPKLMSEQIDLSHLVFNQVKPKA